jgi:hypothetical protein
MVATSSGWPTRRTRISRGTLEQRSKVMPCTLGSRAQHVGGDEARCDGVGVTLNDRFDRECLREALGDFAAE